VRITRDDEIGAGGERASEHLVVVGIGGDGRRDLGRRDDLDDLSIVRDERLDRGAD
jgi:hypothetical protein